MVKYKVYYILRKDLNMSPAKLAVQTAHGTAILYNCQELEVELFEWYHRNDMKKVVLEIENQDKYDKLWKKCVQDKLFVHQIYDLGLTEFDGFTHTGIVILLNEDDVPNYIKRLRLYK